MFIIVNLSILTVLLLMSPAFGAGQQMMRTRVPPDKLEEARSLTNPLQASPNLLEKGKALYEGKGTCANCHGMAGRGDGPGGANLNPPPRIFKSRGFWKHRTEGEIFWVIKNGSTGTAMIPFGGLLSDEEIWTVIQYERSFAGDGGHGRGRHEGMSGKGRKGHGGGQHEGRERHGSPENDPQEGSHQALLQKAEKAAGAEINIDQAIVAATQRVRGTVFEAEFEDEEDPAVWEFKVVDEDGKVMEVKVDSETGDVILVEEQEAEKNKN